MKVKMIYSDYLEEMIPRGFTLNGVHYTWDETDLVYWSDETDDSYFFEVPSKGQMDMG